MNKITISITGHRLLSGAQKEKITPVLQKAIQNILFTVREHDPVASFVALSPLAEGADTLFARAALSQGLPLHVLLPFEQEIYLKDFSSDEVRQDFLTLYNGVDHQYRSTLNSAKDNDTNELYFKLGQKVVEDADYLVAIWNGKPSAGLGGTGDVVAYALQKKKHVLIINPEDERPRINYLHPDHYTHTPGKDLIDTKQTDHLVDFIDMQQRGFDNAAAVNNWKYKRVWAACFVIGLIEVLAFSIIISFHVSLLLHFILASVEFLCIASIIVLLLFGHAGRYHSRYVHSRIVSERLRIKRFFAELGFHIHHTIVSPIYFSFKEKPEYSILDNTIRLINLSAFSYLSFEEKKKRLDDGLITGQYKYHERKKEKFEKKNTLYKRVRSALFLVFVGAVVLHFCHVANEFFLHQGIHLTEWEPPLFHYKLFEEILLFLSVFVPATVAASEALKYLYEWEKIITLSASMAGYFKERSKKLEHTHTDSDLEELLNAINKDMLIENLDWEKYMQDKNEVPT